VKRHLSISLFDLDYCIDFLKAKNVLFYFDSERRARMAVEYLVMKGIKAAAALQRRFRVRPLFSKEKDALEYRLFFNNLI